MSGFPESSRTILLAKARQRAAQIQGLGKQLQSDVERVVDTRRGRLGPFLPALYHRDIVHNKMVQGRVPLGAGEGPLPVPNKCFLL